MGHWIHLHLPDLGPTAPRIRWDRAQSISYCARLTEFHYENFSVVSTLLPRRLARPFQAVYSFCRWSDDLGDETGAAATELLQWWRTLTQEAWVKPAWHPVFVALQPVIDQYQLPIQSFLDLIDAFEQDQHITRYHDWPDLIDYCRRSANPVGRIVLRLGNSFNEANAELSDRICTGLQLINFWQDVARDWRDLQRIYIPEAVAQKFGYSQQLHVQEIDTEVFRQLMKHLVGTARSYLLQGKPLIQQVDRSLQLAIDLFISGGLAIAQELQAIDYAVWQLRPKVSKQQKGKLLLQALKRDLFRRIPFLPARG